MSSSPKKLWTPTDEVKRAANLSIFMDWLARTHGLNFDDYDSLWKWSTTDYEKFWASLLNYFRVQYDGDFSRIVSQREMPGIKWFEGTRLNYAEHIFRNASEKYPAVITANESGVVSAISWHELTSRVSSIAQFLKFKGVKKGDCVAGYLPNIPEATVAFLATNSIGAIWTSCSPDFGMQAVVDRFAQVKPKVLIAVTGYSYGGKFFDKEPVVDNLVKSLPSLQQVILIGDSGSSHQKWNEIKPSNLTLTFERIDFNDPIWVLYSSGTTGLPKAITHSQGGVLLEQLKYLTFHQDVHAGERCFWYSTTGWMMWNYLHGCLLCGGTMVLYDGSPAYPDLDVLWKLSQDAGIHHFGTSAGFILANMKDHRSPRQHFDLSSLRSLGSTGSTLPPEGFDWVYDELKKDIWLTSMSGGTDVCSAFVGGNPIWPVYSGEIQCRALGCKLEAWDESGRAVVGEEGEMVISAPMPCMPIYFWNDPDFLRYRESYFEMYPGIWRHGDWIQVTERQGVIIYGRSDATLNRDGIRIGTSEIYRTLDKVKEVKDSLIICIEKPGGKFYMPLFVMMKDDESLSSDITRKINQLLRTECSPRHVPDEIIAVPDIPYTISGKKTETPVKKILMGKDPKKVISLGSLRNPSSLNFFVDFYKS